MATFYGGEQLANTITFAPSSHIGNTAIYTVPSGKYARVYVKFVRLQEIAINFTNHTVNEVIAGPGIHYPSVSMVLNSGDVLWYESTLATPIADPFNIFVEEYTLP